MDDPELLLLDRVATPDELAEDADFELTSKALAYLAQHAAVGADARGGILG